MEFWSWLSLQALSIAFRKHEDERLPGVSEYHSEVSQSLLDAINAILSKQLFLTLS